MNQQTPLSEDDLDIISIELGDIFEDTWTQQKINDNRFEEKVEKNVSEEEFLVVDIHYSLEECVSNNEFSDLKEQFPLAKEPYVMNSRLAPVQRQDWDHSFEFYVGQVTYFINIL